MFICFKEMNNLFTDVVIEQINDYNEPKCPF